MSGNVVYPANNPNGGIGWTGTTIGAKTAMDVNILGGADIDVESTSFAGRYLVGKSSGGDFSTAFASATTITIAALPSYHATFIADDVMAVVQIATDGSVTATFNRNDSIMTDAGNVLTVAGATFAASDTFVIYSNINRRNDSEFTEDVAHTDADAGSHVLTVRDDAPVAKAGTDGDYQSLTTDDVGALWQRSRAYDSSSDADKSFETSPIWNQHVEETIADVTNETDATTNYFVDMDGFSELNLQMIISGGSGTMTVTIEASAQDDGTAAASVTYTDVTSDVFGAASFTATTFLFDDAKVLGGAKFVKIKTVSSTGGSNDADITIYAKKLY